MKHGTAWWGATLGAAILIGGGPATASDHSDRCDSSDGRFVVEEGSLYDAEAYRLGSAKALPFRVLSETVEAEEVGYCISWAKEASGRRFEFRYRRSVERIAFEIDGTAREAEMRCVLEGDGLPAAFECDRKVVTRHMGVVTPISTPPATSSGESGGPDGAGGSAELARAIDAAIDGKPGGPVPVSTTHDAGVWEHNGSMLALIADGDDRRFNYTQPRAGLLPNGVEVGTLLFAGRMEGTSLVGRARIFTRSCGELSYPVRGAFENGGARLVLTGKVPRVDTDCRPTAWADDRLVFVRRK